MAREVSVGKQSFADMREHGDFMVDKTAFLRDWWNARDDVTLICRPRRFGKTLALSTVECFFSRDYAGRGEELFGGLDVWADPAMRELQGTMPVVALSFASVKRPTLAETLLELKRIIRVAVEAHGYLCESPALTRSDRAFLARVADDMDDVTATTCLGELCRMLYAHHGARPIVLLDEYDTPMQEAWLGGFWDGMSSFVRSLFNSTFKTNPSLGRALITGITRVASESIFSDLNNPSVITVSTPAYENAFGFSQAEVDAALEEFGLSDRRDDVRTWYDGFAFGDVSGIYNPWSITNFLKRRRLAPYWVNTSSNALVSSLVRRGDEDLKADFEELLAGRAVTHRVDECVNFRQLGDSPDAVWSLLLATGYVRIAGHDELWDKLELRLVNQEVRRGFDGMVREWFSPASGNYNRFCRALLAGDVRAMNAYLGRVALACASSFDAGTHPSEAAEPERFYHGLVLGMLVELRGRYSVESNRESGFGRYDVALVPNDGAGGVDPAVIIEFKVFDELDERTLGDTVDSALAQIEERRYAAGLEERGIDSGRIRRYGIAFCGKKVLVGA